MKKILFLGAGFHQSYAIQRARALGYYTIAIDNLPNSIGFEYAHQKVQMNINNLAGCLAIAQINQVHGVMNSYLDAGMMTSAHIVSEMNLPGVPTQIAESIKDKFTLRNVLKQSNLSDTEKIYLLNDLDDLYNVADFIHFPVLLKPVAPLEDGILSKKAQNLGELREYFIKARALSTTKQVIVEDYIEGREFIVEVFVDQGEVKIYGVMEKLKEFNPEYVEVGYKTIAKLPDDSVIRDLITQAIKALGIEFGSVNVGVVSTQDNKYQILNVKPGLGGSVISSHIIPKVLRYQYIDNAIRASVNDPFELPTIRYTKNVVTRKLKLTEGQRLKIDSVAHFEKENHVKLYYYEPGKNSGMDEALESILYIIGAEDSLYVAEENVNRITKLIIEKHIENKELAYVGV